jgi:hypothetical protein
LKQLHWDYYVSGKLIDENNKKETIHKKDDHAPDAARYFFTFLPDLADIGFTHAHDEPDPNVGIPVGTIWDMLNKHNGTFQESGWQIQTGFSVSGLGLEEEEEEYV